jgi:hypothetical protein
LATPKKTDDESFSAKEAQARFEAALKVRYAAIPLQLLPFRLGDELFSWAANCCGPLHFFRLR